MQKYKTSYFFLLWKFSTHPVSWKKHRGTVFGSASRKQANDITVDAGAILIHELSKPKGEGAKSPSQTQGAKKNHSKYSFIVLFV